VPQVPEAVPPVPALCEDGAPQEVPQVPEAVPPVPALCKDEAPAKSKGRRKRNPEKEREYARISRERCNKDPLRKAMRLQKDRERKQAQQKKKKNLS